MMKKAKNLLRWAKENIWLIIFLPIILPLILLFRLYVWLYILAHCNIIKWADGSWKLTLDPHRHD